MFVVAVRGDAPLTIVIVEQQRIIRVDPGTSFVSRTVHKEAFIDCENASGSLLPTSVPSPGATLDLIGARGSNHDFSLFGTVIRF